MGYRGKGGQSCPRTQNGLILTGHSFMSILLSPGTKGSMKSVCDCQRLAGAQSKQLPHNLIPATFHSWDAFYETTVATHCSEPCYLPKVTSAGLHPGLWITGQAQHIPRSPSCPDSQGYPSYMMAKRVPCTASCRTDASNICVTQGRTPSGTSQRPQRAASEPTPTALQACGTSVKD